MNELQPFIKFPWSEEENGIYLTSDQIKETYGIILNALQYRNRFEKNMKEKNYAAAANIDLSLAKNFNLFRDAVTTNIFNLETRKYIMECVRSIRDLKVNKKRKQNAFEMLNNFFLANTLRRQIIAEYLKNNSKLINFKKLFDLVNKGQGEILAKYLEIINQVYTAYKNENYDISKIII